jgi:hypothetical protein
MLRRSSHRTTDPRASAGKASSPVGVAAGRFMAAIAPAWRQPSEAQSPSRCRGRCWDTIPCMACA